MKEGKEGEEGKEEMKIAKKKVKNYKDLNVWLESHRLAVEVYKLTSGFPKEHRYELTSQLNRAALSVPTNIAEGNSAWHSKEFIQFLNIAYRSANEVDYLLFFAKDVGLMTGSQLRDFEDSYAKVKNMLGALRRSLEKYSSSPSSPSFSRVN